MGLLLHSLVTSMTLLLAGLGPRPPSYSCLTARGPFIHSQERTDTCATAVWRILCLCRWGIPPRCMQPPLAYVGVLPTSITALIWTADSSNWPRTCGVHLHHVCIESQHGIIQAVTFIPSPPPSPLSRPLPFANHLPMFHATPTHLYRRYASVYH